MRPNLITRLKEEWNNLDPVDPLRGLIADAIDALAEKPAQQQEPVAPKCGAIIEVFGKDWRLEYLCLPVGRHKLYTQQYTYTSPPASKPLTGVLSIAYSGGRVVTCSFKTEAEAKAFEQYAIEVAHGIKE